MPKIGGSAVTLSVVPDGEGDAKYWVELGASIMLDKPMIVVAFDRRSIPRKLRLVADEIVYLPRGVNPEASEALVAAMERTTRRHKRPPPPPRKA